MILKAAIHSFWAINHGSRNASVLKMSRIDRWPVHFDVQSVFVKPVGGQ